MLGNTNTNSGGGGGGDGEGGGGGSGGGKQTTLSMSESRSFKRVSQTTSSSNSTTLSGGTVVSVKQEVPVDNLVASYVDSTTFVNSPSVQQQTNTIRQQSSSQTVQLRNGDDFEMPSKLWVVVVVVVAVEGCKKIVL